MFALASDLWVGMCPLGEEVTVKPGILTPQGRGDSGSQGSGRLAISESSARGPSAWRDPLARAGPSVLLAFPSSLRDDQALQDPVMPANAHLDLLRKPAACWVDPGWGASALKTRAFLAPTHSRSPLMVCWADRSPPVKSLGPVLGEVLFLCPFFLVGNGGTTCLLPGLTLGLAGQSRCQG